MEPWDRKMNPITMFPPNRKQATKEQRKKWNAVSKQRRILANNPPDAQKQP